MTRAACALLVAACSSGSASPDAAGDAPGGAGQRLIAYVSGYGPDIAWLDFDPAAGRLTPVGALAAMQGAPSFLALTQSHVYAVSESASRAAAYAIDPASGALRYVNDVDSGGDGPAHIAVDRSGAFVLVANYGDGTAAVLPIRGDGGLAAASQIVTAGANAHMVLLEDQAAFIPCKGADYVAQYRFADGTLEPAGNVPTASGAGPRHLAFAPDGAHAYLINENDSTLTVLAFAGGQLTPLQTVSTRAAGAAGANTGAEVWVHPSGRTVYASNRGDDNIAVFGIAGDRVTLVGHVSTEGKTPRDFVIDPTGRWLLAANQDSNTVVTFAIDAATGMLTRTASLAATRPSFIGFVALPAR